MLFGIGFLSVLTATVASQFVKADTGNSEVLETLRGIEADVARPERVRQFGGDDLRSLDRRSRFH